MIGIEEAQRRLFALATRVSTEVVPAQQALNRYPAHDVFARRTQPYADLSAMDGYAVGGLQRQSWQVIGESAAGSPFPSEMPVGAAIRIFTGAAVPTGATAVIPQELVSRTGDRVALTAPMPEPPYRHVRPKGSDFIRGTRIITAGTEITPRTVGFALSAGVAEITVRRRPSVTIIQCGNELTSDPLAADPAQLVACNGPMLAGLLSAMEVSTHLTPIVPDNRHQLVEAIAAAANDVIVTIGGASVGDHDLVRPALQTIGARLDFWQVAMKPGKPLMVATHGDAIILGLPGNPASAFVTAYFFLLPLIRHLAGASACLPSPVLLHAGTEFASGGSRREFIRVTRKGGAVVPSGVNESGAMRSLAQATHLLDRPINAPAITTGDLVPCYDLGNTSHA